MQRNLMRVAVVAVALVVLAGCRTVEVKPIDSVTLVVAHSGDQAILQWRSTAGRTYNVFYTDKLSGRADWKILPQGQNIKGNGGDITLTDSVPVANQRYYRLHIGVVAPR